MTLLDLDREIEIGRYYGAPIRLHLYFFVAAAILTFPWWIRFRIVDIALAVIMTAILLLSVLLHELAHGEVAHDYDIAPRCIGIGLYGGVILFKKRPRGVRRECAIALAGPLVNLVLGGIALGALGVLALVMPPPVIEIGAFPGSPIVPTLLERAVRAAAYINLGLCVVNLLPGFPLDGGRILYALVADRWGHRTAMRCVGLSGVVLAAISKIVLVMTTLAGFPLWSPPEFRLNWRAFQAGRRRRARDDFDPFVDPVMEP